jgi:hypothetical protein
MLTKNMDVWIFTSALRCKTEMMGIGYAFTHLPKLERFAAKACPELVDVAAPTGAAVFCRSGFSREAACRMG